MISEATFLLSELRYTLTQLHTQWAELLTASDDDTTWKERVKQSISQMGACERVYLERYAELLDIPTPPDSDNSVLDPQAAFAHQRALTIQILQETAQDRHVDFVDVLRKHVADDRKHMTEIADQRPEVRRRATQDTPS